MSKISKSPTLYYTDNVSFNGEFLEDVCERKFTFTKQVNTINVPSVVNEKEADHLLNAVAKQQRHLYDTTARVFRTVYKQVTLNCPFFRL